MTARISLDPPRSLLFRAVSWYSNRAYGKVIDPLRAGAHHTGVLWAYSRLELSAGRWKKLDPQLKALAVMASAATVGCSWCMDFGYWVSHSQGMDPRKLREVPEWRESDAYTPLEREVLAYAEAMTVTPPRVEDEMVDRLRSSLGEAALVELTSMIAVENMRSRSNSALGLTSQGFKDRCELQPPGASGRHTPATDR
ncbi:carboxymuconolactone decarboxylase family protein [Streptomyces sp. BE230]|uniref:carboxymuconolactone decarboxylase family protein n=1 Tax=Streptomyces sp. BE230 TaxID=3002526 RepID=UPI002ED5C686|nr:carboxymuconolactone decarboxylase family protein [Streptomyces sp. BE230]